MVAKYALWLPMVTSVDGLEWGCFEVESGFFSVFCRKVLILLLTRDSVPLVTIIVSRIISQCSKNDLLELAVKWR